MAEGGTALYWNGVTKSGMQITNEVYMQLTTNLCSVGAIFYLYVCVTQGKIYDWSRGGCILAKSDRQVGNLLPSGGRHCFCPF